MAMGEASALGGLRIIDLADEKGAFCSKLLADMGADVVKVEKPGGEPSRRIGPFLGDIPHPERSLAFWYYNTSKRGITLDLETSKGQKLFKQLVGIVDIIVETSPPGYLEGLGLAYEDLNQLNPRLIMTSITNFGQTGPYRDYHSCDIVASALGGQLYVCGGPDTSPLKPYGEQSYLIASLFGAIGTLLALNHRHINGKGQHIDISLQESVAATLEHVNVRYLYEKVIPKRQGSLHWNKAFRLLPCQDGYILLSLFHNWDTLVEWLDGEGRAADLKEQKWQSQAIRLKESEHVFEVLEGWIRTRKVAELVELSQLMRFPWAKVNSPADVVHNPQLVERGFFVEVAHPELGTKVQYPGAPYRFSQSRWRISKRAPLVGEHNEEIYTKELGLSKEEIAALASEGII